MLPDLAMINCQDLAVPAAVMQHVVHVESSFNPYAIGVVGGHLARQPQNLSEAVATARMLDSHGYNFSLGLAQVNRYNLGRYGLTSYEKAFQSCPNLQAGSRILAQCMARAGNDWGKSFSCYYSGNFTSGFQQGYVQKIFASMRGTAVAAGTLAIDVIDNASHRRISSPARITAMPLSSVLSRRITSIDSPPAAGRTIVQPASVQAAATIPQITPTQPDETPIRVTLMGASPTSRPTATGADPVSQAHVSDAAFVF